MEFSLISDEKFILNDAHRCPVNDDASHIPKNNLNFFNDNLGQSSRTGWSFSPDLTDISNQHHHQNLIPLIPNYDSQNQNLDTNQNHLVYNSSSYEIPSNYPFMSIKSYSNIDTLEQSMNNIVNDGKIHMIDNPPIFANPKGIFENFHDLQEYTIGNEIVHNEELTNKGYEPTLDKVMGEPQLFDVPVLEGIKNTTNEIMNQLEDDKMKKTYQNKKEVSTSKYLKKSDITKKRWTESEDIKLKEMVALEPKKWTKVAKHFEGRTPKQCRERWHNHARPNVKKTTWSEEEDQILIEVHKVIGAKWIQISEQLPGRSYNNVKNHWNTTKRRVQNKSGRTVNRVGNNILENYIRSITINNDDESDGEPTNIENYHDDSEDMLYGEMNLSPEAITQTTKPLTDASTISPYIPMPKENYTLEVCESLEDYLELLRWWD
ncbi:unnamed protein product [Arabidopsis thaliana]|uniref:Uncharacterized protein n=1 Tax=Arabidopsis thaliana TaxID=3702 RepID=A0A5S9YA10_ARATH|nr:unnamed protein product [Arabidopsis thaliana]